MTDTIAALEEFIWPFDVPPPQERTYLEARTVEFFEAAATVGAEAYMFGPGNVGARLTSGDRGGIILVRGRHRWEVALGTSSETSLSMQTTDFDAAARAVLDWMSGESIAAIRTRLAPSQARQVTSTAGQASA